MDYLAFAVCNLRTYRDGELLYPRPGWLGAGAAADHEWRKDWRFWSLVVTCSVLPDADSIGFHAGVPYGALWGHRGMTHSLLFAAVLAAALALAFRRRLPPPRKLGVLLF